jgi:hypothetical protein
VFVLNVSSVSDVSCKRFDLDVVYVSHICCKNMFQIFHLFHSYVAVSIFYLASCKYFYLDVTYVEVAIQVCCKCVFQMFQLFQTSVASVLSGCYICCSGYTHMLRAYVPNVSHVLDVQ